MNKVVFAFIIFTLSHISVTGQVNLKITITNLKNNSGHVILDFRDSNNKEFKAFSEKITEKKCMITVNDLKPGKYSFKYFHDENNNKKLDTNWVGIPKEGYGFSNDAKGYFGPPTFEDTVFEIKNDTHVVGLTHYINL